MLVLISLCIILLVLVHFVSLYRSIRTSIHVRVSSSACIDFCGIHAKIDFPIRVPLELILSRGDVPLVTQEPPNFESLCLQMIPSKTPCLLVLTIYKGRHGVHEGRSVCIYMYMVVRCASPKYHHHSGGVAPYNSSMIPL